MPPGLDDAHTVSAHSIRFMIEENKRPKTRSLLLEMWAMANRSRSIARMMDTFYGRMRGWIEAMLAEIDPGASPAARSLRAAQIEGLLLIGIDRPAEAALLGIEGAAVQQIQRLATGA